MIKLKNLLLENTINFQSMIDDRQIQESIKTFGSEKTEDYFNQIVKMVLKTLFVYRLISLRKNVSPLEIQKLGIFWTDSYETAMDWSNNWDHHPDKPIRCIFEARLSDKSIIDWPLTINHRFNYINYNPYHEPDVTGGDEREIVLKENSRIRLLKLYSYDINTPKESFKTLTVNSFRSTGEWDESTGEYDASNDPNLFS